MDGLIQTQVVVQGNAGVVGLVGLDTQGRVWYGELSGARSPPALIFAERGASFGPCEAISTRVTRHAPRGPSPNRATDVPRPLST